MEVLMPLFSFFFFGLIVILLIYLIVKRIVDKDNEKFEKRDN